MKRQEKSTPHRTSPPAPLPIGRGEGGSVRGGEGMPALPPGQMFFTKPQMAGILQVSVRTVTSMMANGELCYLKLRGRFVRFRLEDVQRRLNETAFVCNGAKAKDNA